MFILQLQYKILLSFLLITALCHHSCFSNTLSNYDSLEIHCTGTYHDNFIIDTKSLEDLSRYKLLAQKGELPFQSSENEIEDWYKFVSQPRSYPIEYTFYKNNDLIKKQIICPAGTYRPWEAFQEYILNGNNYFIILHAFKTVQVSDDLRYHSQAYNFMFDPSILLLSVSPNDNQTITLHNINETQSKVTLEYQDRDHVQSTLTQMRDSSLGGLPTKSLYISNDYSRGVRFIWYSVINSYEEKSGMNLPMKFEVIHCNQSINTKDEDLKLQGTKYLNKDVIVDMDFFEHHEQLENFVFKIELEITSIVFNTLTTDSFWPSVPKGYSYKDSRLRNSDLFLKKELSQLEEKRFRGYGPYEFPK